MRGMQQQLGNLGTISALACRHRETKKNLCRGGRSRDLPDTDFQPAVRHLKLACINKNTRPQGEYCQGGAFDCKKISSSVVLGDTLYIIHYKHVEDYNVTYEGGNFNSGNYLFTTDTKQIHVSKFYCPSVQSPALCTTRCQRCGSRRIPLAAPVVLIVRMERSTA